MKPCYVLLPVLVIFLLVQSIFLLGSVLQWLGVVASKRNGTGNGFMCLSLRLYAGLKVIVKSFLLMPVSFYGICLKQ